MPNKNPSWWQNLSASQATLVVAVISLVSATTTSLLPILLRKAGVNFASADVQSSKVQFADSSATNSIFAGGDITQNGPSPKQMTEAVADGLRDYDQWPNILGKDVEILSQEFGYVPDTEGSGMKLQKVFMDLAGVAMQLDDESEMTPEVIQRILSSESKNVEGAEEETVVMVRAMNKALDDLDRKYAPQIGKLSVTLQNKSNRRLGKVYSIVSLYDKDGAHLGNVTSSHFGVSGNSTFIIADQFSTKNVTSVKVIAVMQQPEG